MNLYGIIARKITLNVFTVILVTDCDDLSCGENEICVKAGDTFECVCHPDFEGENCMTKGNICLPTFIMDNNHSSNACREYKDLYQLRKHSFMQHTIV